MPDQRNAPSNDVFVLLEQVEPATRLDDLETHGHVDELGASDGHLAEPVQEHHGRHRARSAGTVRRDSSSNCLRRSSATTCPIPTTLIRLRVGERTCRLSKAFGAVMG